MCRSLLFGLLLIASAASASSADLHVIEQADFALTSAPTPPKVYPEQRRLPDFWDDDDRHSSSPWGWYRVALPHEPPAEPWAVLLIKFTMNVEVWFNGRRVDASGAMTLDGPINWNRPFLFRLPPDHWRAVDNALEIRLVTAPTWGLLTPVVVGSAERLQVEYQRRLFGQITFNQVAFLLALIIATISLVYWVSDRRSTHYGWLAATAALWSISAANYFVTAFPLPIPIWSVFFHISLDLFALSVLMFTHRFLRIERRWLERAMFAFVGLAGGWYALSRLVLEVQVTGALHLVGALSGVYLTVLAGQYFWRDPGVQTGGLFLALVAMVGFAVYDTAFALAGVTGAWLSQFYLLQFATPLVLVLLLLLVSREFVTALVAARAANEQLEARVAAVTAQLEQSFRERRDAEQAQAAARERERIVQDLHDDVGAKLLSLVYAAQSARERSLARSAIEDIRSIVGAGSGGSGDVLLALEEETAQRCQDAGIALSWQVEDLEVSAGSQMGYHLPRVLRELVSNALRHAACSSIRVSVAATEGQLFATVVDNGCGPDDGGAVEGTGMSGIRRRLNALGGQVSWCAGEEGGTRVELRCPYRQVSA